MKLKLLLSIIGVLIVMQNGDVLNFPLGDAIIIHREASDTEDWVWVGKMENNSMVGIVAFPESKVKKAEMVFGEKL